MNDWIIDNKNSAKETNKQMKLKRLDNQGIKYNKKETEELVDIAFEFSQKCVKCKRYCDCVKEFTQNCCQCRQKENPNLTIEKFCDTCMIRVTLMGG